MSNSLLSGALGAEKREGCCASSSVEKCQVKGRFSQKLLLDDVVDLLGTHSSQMPAASWNKLRLSGLNRSMDDSIGVVPFAPFSEYEIRARRMIDTGRFRKRSANSTQIESQLWNYKGFNARWMAGEILQDPLATDSEMPAHAVESKCWSAGPFAEETSTSKAMSVVHWKWVEERGHMEHGVPLRQAYP